MNRLSHEKAQEAQNGFLYFSLLLLCIFVAELFGVIRVYLRSSVTAQSFARLLLITFPHGLAR
jgi:hypothetical protein